MKRSDLGREWDPPARSYEQKRNARLKLVGGIALAALVALGIAVVLMR